MIFLIEKYEIKKINKEERLILYLNINVEFANLEKKMQKKTLNTIINDLITKANAAKEPSMKVTKASDEITKTKDGKYYQSAAISVVPSSTSVYSSYAIVPVIDDIIYVDENGEGFQIVEKNVYIPINKKFYVRIPTDKVSEEVKKINIEVKSYTDLGPLVFYKTGNDMYQRLASVSESIIKETIGVEFVGSPDTGMNAVQTIYFIGLIVLLCGVGIVYANAKPVESKQ